MAKDINDLGAEGTGLRAQLAAARATGTAPLQDLAAMQAAGDEGVSKLRAAVDAMRIEQDDVARHLIGLMNPETIAQLALAYRFDQVTPAGLLAEAGRHRGCSTIARDIMRMVKDAEAPVAKPENTRPRDFRDLRVPYGYHVDKAGVYMDTDKGRTVVCHEPLVITARSGDIDSGDKLLRLEWPGGSEVVPRDVVMDARKLVRLAKSGAPVSSARATAVVRYLEALEAENRDRLPYEQSSSHLGWSGNPPVFILPSRSYPEGSTLRAEEGTAQIADFVTTGGTWDGWRAVIGRHCTSRPLLMLALYAAVAAPLLRVLDSPGFVVDFSGETSRGKTTAARVAASVCGVPSDERGLVLKWAAASDVGPTTSAWFLQSLPLILDDTKQGRPDVIAAMLFAIPGGQARLKGTKEGGLRRTPTWRTVMISTGEAPITSFHDHGGAVARALCLTGGPMGDESAENEAAARALEAGLMENHGHLIERIAEHLSDPEARRRLRKRHAGLVDHFAAEASGAVEARMCRYVATMALAQQLAHELGVPRWTESDPIDLALRSAKTGGSESDRPREAMVSLIRWAAANQGKFWGRHVIDRDGVPREPHGGWLGRWDANPKGGRPAWLCVRPEVVQSMLADWGYDVANILESWDRRGWTVEHLNKRSNTRRRQVPVRFGNIKAWLIAVPPEVIDSLS